MSHRLPNFLFLGPDKSGSSWLHAVLSKHPEAYITPAKDLYFFDQYFDRGVDWYASRFRHAKESHIVVGEICHGYLLSPVAAERISATLPGVRVMACLRDPVDRVRSWYLHHQKHGFLNVDINRAIEMRPKTVQAGEYWTQLERYRQLIGRDRMYVAVFDDLREDPQAFLNGLTDWLGLSRLTLDDEDRAPRRQASEARNAAVARLVKRSATVARKARLEALIGRVKNNDFLASALYRSLDPDKFEMPAEASKMLRERLYDEVYRCERDYGVSLMHRWGWV